MTDPSYPSNENHSPVLLGNSAWENANATLRQAALARAAEDIARAHALYVRAAELNPNDPRSWAGLGATVPTTDEAIICWGYALALAPDNYDAQVELDTHIAERIEHSGIADAPVLVALAHTLAEVGDKARAHRLLVHATELDPTFIEGWLWRAGVTQDNTETISCLRQVLSLDPTNTQAEAGLKWAQAHQTPPAERRSPETAHESEALFEQGQQALRDGDVAKAHIFFKRATDSDPENESAWVWRGSTAPTTEEALICMERALTINPNDQSIHDARWWLRIKKIRESAQNRAYTFTPTIGVPPVESTPTRRTTNRAVIAGALALLFLLAVIGGLVVHSLR